MQDAIKRKISWRNWLEKFVEDFFWRKKIHAKHVCKNEVDKEEMAHNKKIQDKEVRIYKIGCQNNEDGKTKKPQQS